MQNHKKVKGSEVPKKNLVNCAPWKLPNQFSIMVGWHIKGHRFWCECRFCWCRINLSWVANLERMKHKSVCLFPLCNKLKITSNKAWKQKCFFRLALLVPARYTNQSQAATLPAQLIQTLPALIRILDHLGRSGGLANSRANTS